MFYNFKLNYTTITKGKNEIGQVVETVTKGDVFAGDLQPISEEEKQRQWGNRVVGEFNLFTNAFLNVNDCVMYNNDVYKVVDKKDWIDYRVFLLMQEEK